jgi:acetylornithine aminotransferase
MKTGLEDVRKVLLSDCHIFTGEAKPNVVRLLPSLALTKEQVDQFIIGLKKAIAIVQSKNKA